MQTLPSMAIGAGFGAAKGYFDHNLKKADEERLVKEQSRKVELLQKREAVRANFKYQNDYNLQKLKGEQDIALEQEKAKTDTSKSSHGLTEQQLVKLDSDMRKDYDTQKTAVYGEEFPVYDEWLRNERPYQAKYFKTTDSPVKDTGVASLVQSVIDRVGTIRVKGKGGSSEEQMMSSHSINTDNSVRDLPVKAGGVTNASEYDSKKDGYPAPLNMTTIEDSSSSDVKNIEADKSKKIPAKVHAKIKEAERVISKTGHKGGDTRLRELIGAAAKGIGSLTAQGWAKLSDALESRLNELEVEHKNKK